MVTVCGGGTSTQLVDHTCNDSMVCVCVCVQ